MDGLSAGRLDERCFVESTGGSLLSYHEVTA